MEDYAYVQNIAPFRLACGLPPLPFEKKQPVDYTGNWIINEEKSILDDYGVSSVPYKLNIIHKGNDITIQRTRIIEYADDVITEEKMTLDGKEYESTFWNSPRINTAMWSDDGKSLIFDSRITFTRGNSISEMIINEVWSLTENAENLSVEQSTTSGRGIRNITLVYDKH